MRTPVDDSTLAMLVTEQLQVRISSGDMFTAYNITQMLRHRHPDRHIAHAVVRVLVHRLMEAHIHAGEYDTAQRYFGRRSAVLYRPRS
ncbi:MAG TPA: hypothetical protein VM409_00075, partial [Chloroflexia bacterium]|nr:hypothetical protein [Chloroflexia bacterium]